MGEVTNSKEQEKLLSQENILIYKGKEPWLYEFYLYIIIISLSSLLFNALFSLFLSLSSLSNSFSVSLNVFSKTTHRQGFQSNLYLCNMSVYFSHTTSPLSSPSFSLMLFIYVSLSYTPSPNVSLSFTQSLSLSRVYVSLPLAQHQHVLLLFFAS